MKHKVKLVRNLMYNGREILTQCDVHIPVCRYSKEELENTDFKENKNGNQKCCKQWSADSK